jgi:hypothetical protein
MESSWSAQRPWGRLTAPWLKQRGWQRLASPRRRPARCGSLALLRSRPRPLTRRNALLPSHALFVTAARRLGEGGAHAGPRARGGAWALATLDHVLVRTAPMTTLDRLLVEFQRFGSTWTQGMAKQRLQNCWAELSGRRIFYTRKRLPRTGPHSPGRTWAAQCLQFGVLFSLFSSASLSLTQPDAR